MITLYDMPLALNCYKVRLLLSLLGVEYRREPIDLLEGEHKTPEFLAINPFGQLPVLRGGRHRAPRLAGNPRVDRAEVRERLMDAERSR